MDHFEGCLKGIVIAILLLLSFPRRIRQGPAPGRFTLKDNKEVFAYIAR
jgi:hypothetical protein